MERGETLSQAACKGRIDIFFPPRFEKTMDKKTLPSEGKVWLKSLSDEERTNLGLTCAQCGDELNTGIHGQKRICSICARDNDWEPDIQAELEYRAEMEAEKDES